MNSKQKISENKFEENLPLKTKLSFGTAETAHAILNGIAFSAITFYYNVKLGLSENLIGLAWLIFAFWNALNDPLFGIIEDRTKSKYGRRIPYIRFGAPIYGFLFILVWIPLFGMESEFLLFLYLLFILFAFDTIYTITGLIMFSMPAEMTVSSKARANLMIYGAIFSALGFLITMTLSVLLLTGSETTTIDPAFILSMVIVGIICTLVLIISSFYLKENKYTQNEEPLGFIDGIKETFKNKPFLVYEVNIFLFTIAQTILTTAVFYYINFVLELSGIMAILPLILFFIMIFVCTPLYSKMVGKYGVKKTYLFSLYLSALSFILFFIVGWNFSTAIIALILLGIGISGVFVTNQIVFAETIDHDEILTKKRRETTYSGVNALITKPSISIANFLFLFIIAYYGFQRASPTQTETVKFGIMLGFTIIPAIFIFLSAFAMKYFQLDGPDWNKQKEELKRIHKEKEKAYLESLKEQNKL